MRQYNDSTTIAARLRLCIGVLLGLLAAGCAGTQPPGPTPSASTGATGVAQTQAPQTRRISDQTLRRAVRDDAPRRYVVQPGDTLWEIAGHFLAKPSYWPQLWHRNPRIDNPHRIHPGDVLLLSRVDGRPRIKLSPQVRELPVHRPIPAIPAAAVTNLLDAPRLVSKRQLKQAPYIVAFQGQHLLAGEHMTAFVRGLPPGSPAYFDIVRPGAALIDPESGRRIGILALPVGQLAITRRGSAIATARITDSQLAAHPGDRLLPARTRIEVADFRLHTPRRPVEAAIIATYGGSSVVGQYDVVVINRGARSGLERGHLLQIQQAPRTVPDPLRQGATITLPPQTIGTLMLFEVEEQTSLGIVLDATHAIHEGDRVTAPAT